MRRSLFCMRAAVKSFRPVPGMKSRTPSTSIGEHDSVPNRKQNVLDPLAFLNPIVQSGTRSRVVILWTETPPAPQHVVQYNKPALPHQINGAIVVVAVTFFVSVDKTEIEWSL